MMKTLSHKQAEEVKPVVMIGENSPVLTTANDEFAATIDLFCQSREKPCAPKWDADSQWYGSNCCGATLMQRDWSREDAGAFYVEADPQDVLRVADDEPYFEALSVRAQERNERS